MIIRKALLLFSRKVAAAFFGWVLISTFALAGITERVSVNSAGVEGNNFSNVPAISADGRFVAFRSGASNLVAGDTNGTGDVFVHDRATGATSRVSVNSSGVEGNGDSARDIPAISADGRFVAFVSGANNLVAGDTNGEEDIFVHDRDIGATFRVSIDSAGNQANGSSFEPAISADGHFVVFHSFASNLVAGDTNPLDVFVHDRVTGATTRVSVDSSGNQAAGGSARPAISADGRFVAFGSGASNLVTGDTNGRPDVFVHDRDTGATTRVSVDSAGIEGNSDSDNPAISADGRFVAFNSRASNLVAGDTNGRYDVFVHDRVTGTTSRMSVDSAGVEGNGDSFTQSDISADGRFTTFPSRASNLVTGDTNSTNDVFVHDRLTGTTSRVSVDSAGVEANGSSSNPAISADGRFVAFSSGASNLVASDTNGAFDVFVHGRDPIADAGPDQAVDEGTLVTLDGSASAYATNYSWSQVAGDSVSLSDPSVVNPSFDAPYVSINTTLTFELIVDDGAGNFSDPDTVDITVVSVNNPPDADAGDDSTIKEGAVATLDGSNSFDPEGDTPLGYAWTQIAGPAVTLQPSDSVVSPTFTAPWGSAPCSASTW
ncbi:TolB family protein [Marinobacterium aestuariivivens]|uniref:Uncharacterized protein n=1 Tax=Marinobacterium aestuariivivens TaxID=1698799 RepID=A0ABW2AA70_9GAMM